MSLLNAEQLVCKCLGGRGSLHVCEMILLTNVLSCYRWRAYCVKRFSFLISFNLQQSYDVATCVHTSAQGHNASGRTGTQTQDFDPRPLVHKSLLSVPSEMIRFWIIPGIGGFPLWETLLDIWANLDFPMIII